MIVTLCDQFSNVLYVACDNHTCVMTDMYYYFNCSYGFVLVKSTVFVNDTWCDFCSHGAMIGIYCTYYNCSHGNVFLTITVIVRKIVGAMRPGGAGRCLYCMMGHTVGLYNT